MSDDSSVTRRALLTAAATATVGSTAGCAEVSTPADVARGDLDSLALDRLVDAAWLADNRGDVVVLDARPRSAYRTERVYGARRVSRETVTARREADTGRVPDAEAIAAAFADAGVAPDDDVVIYGSSVGSRVTRLAFALDYLGHEGDVAVLDGGYETWNGRVGTGSAPDRRAAYEPDPRGNRIATRGWLADRLEALGSEGGPALVDVRPPEAYLGATGAEALVAANDRHGHLPGAVNVAWTGNVDGSRLEDSAALADLYLDAADLAQDRTVVVYGQGNVNPTNTYFVLRALGFSDVRLYDGGFREWANVPDGERDAHPVETKTTAVIETDGSVGGDDDGGGFSCGA